jgi:ferredoxin-type protein NapF
MVDVTVSRRQFLRGDVRGSRSALRPPWALAEDLFIARCTRCDDCIRACPTAVIRRGSGGYPEMDFGAGACTFCRDCVAACKAGAFSAGAASRFAAFAHRAVIASHCLAANGVVCRACGDGCETGAIRFRLAPAGLSFAQVDLSRCNGCGDCQRVCPAQAISMKVPQAAAEAAA